MPRNKLKRYTGAEVVQPKSIAEQLLAGTKLGNLLYGKQETYKDGYDTERKDASFKESANGQLVQRMGETAKDAGELVATGLAFGNPLTAGEVMAPLITGSQAYWIGYGINDGAQRIENIGEGVQNFVEDPSWQNAKEVAKEVPILALDVAGALPVVKTATTVAKQMLKPTPKYTPAEQVVTTQPTTSKLTEAERLGIPKGERSNPKAIEDPHYWGYKQWNERYNKAAEEWDLDELQRLRDLHFITKAPGAQTITESGMPQRVYHFTYRDHLKGKGSPVRFFNKSSNDYPAPAYFTSSVEGDLTHDPWDIRDRYLFGQYVRGDYYLKMKSPLKEGSETHYSASNIFLPKRGNTPKVLHRDRTMSEPVLNSWRRKALEIHEQMREARRAGDKELFSKLQKQYHYIYDDILNGASNREWSTTNKKMYDLKSDFEDLLKSELKADGVIHNVGDTQHYITFDPQFIKSAEPVTYDDFENIIPIVKRDNFRKIDTNYSKGGKINPYQ